MILGKSPLFEITEKGNEYVFCNSVPGKGLLIRKHIHPQLKKELFVKLITTIKPLILFTFIIRQIKNNEFVKIILNNL